MAGHSKWANIKHRKDRADKKKGKLFSRVTKEILSAVRQGGSDLKSNPKLKAAILKAKEINLPNENIERNIKKAASVEAEGEYTEVSYELYGYGGVGIIAEGMTDNKNRISSEMRIATNQCGGTIASPGSVVYNFDRKGVIKVSTKNVPEMVLFEVITEAGAENFETDGDLYIITTAIETFISVKEAVMSRSMRIEEAELAWVPKLLIEVSDQDADLNIVLIEWLENLDDIDVVYHNMK